MKKSIFLKIVCVVLTLVVFASMATGCVSLINEIARNDASGSNNGGENKNETGSDKAEYSVGETSADTWTDSIGSKWVKVIIPVKNTGNTNLFLETSSVDIEDENGSLVKTLSLVSVFPQVIKPGETAYYFEETTLYETATGDLKVVPHVKAEKAKVECVRFDVSELSVKDQEYMGAKVMGRVENTSSEKQTMVYVVANLFDKDNKLIGQQFTIIDEIAPGEKLGFSTSSLSFEVKASDVASYDVYAFPYQYQW